ncbi:phosphate transport system permease protein [Agromyces flavus]|uniref:Phosphate transport system permease protein PstA n=1 Tax=Agromyces flavus TaxID=589382 RepID=A0A1H1M4I8_9MICO|nr:phosphate ABC transporter permease PstA [Agromyces flavus]MCP2368712.1 phosphate transport system permease protein [Agromyces flavus]GGI48049.1 phosphate transport system permease protein PstA [Agromyces flavus]SDR81681.1 phosphate ABC transporter membrane protein 2, PhoT family [Agromyces flavus]
MTTTVTPPETRSPAATPVSNSLTAGKLPNGAPWFVLGASLAVSAGLFGVIAFAGAEFNWVGTLVVAALVYVVTITLLSRIVEGPRKATDRFVTALVTGAFLLAMIPLVSLAITVLTFGLARFDAEFFTYSMRNITGEGGGIVHAIVGTLLMTGTAALISIPIGLMTSIYLVEYGRGRLARGITFLVDVMTGIPSIVAGLFAYALFAIFWGPGTRTGIAGAVALAVLMIPVVVRSSEEMLRLVPNELREAAYALGVPKWLTIVKVVLPTSIAGITTGIMLSIARVIGETAPLLIAAGFTQSVNYNLFDGRMQSLPVFVYTQYANQGNPPEAYLDRAWAAALTLILIVMALNLIARLVARFFAPKYGR